jgi:photosystem II stability/assembly factor-like uncharacterized protein
VDAGLPQRKVLRSADSGVTWCVLTSSPPANGVVTSRADDVTVYAEQHQTADNPHLLSKSVDAGRTWSTLELGPEITGTLQASLTQPSVVWFQSSSAALRVSRDGGITWTAALPSAWDFEYTITSPFIPIPQGFVVDPGSAERIVAFGIEYTINNQDQLRYYRTLDGGGSWSELSLPEAAVTGFLADAEGTLFVRGSAGNLFRSADWGTTWSEGRQSPAPAGTLTTLGSTSAGRLYLVSPGKLWTSSDGGAQWDSLSLDPELHPVLSLTRTKLLALQPEGLSLSEDSGKTWRGITQPLTPTQLVQSPVDPKRIWSLSTFHQDERLIGRSRASNDGGDTWQVVSRLNQQLVPDGLDADVLYDGMDTSSPRRSEDGGRTWTPFTLPWGASMTASAGCGPGASCLYALKEFQAESGDACRLSRSDDGGRTWSAPWDVPATICYTAVLAVAESPDHLLAGCANAVCESKDGGHTFETHPIDQHPSRYIDELRVLASGVALVVTRTVAELGMEAPPVFARSVDNGSNWTPIAGLDNVPFARFFPSVAHPDTVFLTSRPSNQPARVLRSDDAGLTWRTASPDTNPEFDVFQIVDHAGDDFLAVTNHGLVHFD